ncbi:hypothetical protein ACJMK2_025359 [Sinanodonta woodiana]|uniref:Hormone-sensitive lipase n=1 Tax=Sinanodonta woodiana TaxID=1069815 RepID=A0ABD3XGS9_SINWO
MAKPQLESHRKKDEEFIISFKHLCRELGSLSLSNVEYYRYSKSSISARYHTAFSQLEELVSQTIEPLVCSLVPRLQTFDFSPEVPANGYRSFVKITHSCCLHLLQLCRHISHEKGSLLFRTHHFCKELEAYVDTLGQLRGCLHYLQKLLELSRGDTLFSYVEGAEINEAEQIIMEVEMLNTDCFYGRTAGFQFCNSVHKLVQTLLTIMASFSEGYQEKYSVMKLASSILNSGKYVMDLDLRAKQVTNITRRGDIGFCKAFWSIPESGIFQQIQSLTHRHVQVNKVITLKTDPFEMPLVDNPAETVTITSPCSHTGPGPLKLRLISHELREGQETTVKTSKSQTEIGSPSPALVFHCHGGGFVAQSSKSHETYLRHWTWDLKAPILSVDYALAPEFPFPRALEECFYAYAWALKNHKRLGWTGEKICFAGDSAGGNLALSTALMAVNYGIRIPDGIMVAYPVVLVQYTPSPARLLSMIDPLLPVGILTRCLAAYSGIASDFSSAITKQVPYSPPLEESWDIISQEEVTQEGPSQKNNDNDILRPADMKEDSSEKSPEVHTKLKRLGGFKKRTNFPYKTKDCKDMESPLPVFNSSQSIECSDLTSSMEESSSMPKRMQEVEDLSFSGSTTEVEAMDTSVSLTTKVHQLEDNIHKNITGNTAGVITECDASIEMTFTSPVSGLEVQRGLFIEQDLDSSPTVEGQIAPSSPARHVKCCNSAIIKESNEKDLFCQTGSILDGNEINICDMQKLEFTRQMISSDTADSGIHDDMETSQEREPDIKFTCNEDVQVDNDYITETFDLSPDDRGQQLQKSIDQSNIPEQSGFSFSQRNMPLSSSMNDLPLHSPKEAKQINTNSFKGLKFSFSDGCQKVIPRSTSTSELQSKKFYPKSFPMERQIVQSPIKLFQRLPIAKNPYMSPILAPDELLQGLPKTFIVGCHFDPLLDDSITFAKKLRNLGKMVDLQVVDLPHGFLSFIQASKEAQLAADKCVAKIKAVFQN